MMNNLEIVPDLQWKIEEMIAEGNKVVLRFIVMGTPKEKWIGIPYSGKSFEAGGIFIATSFKWKNY